MAEQQHSETLTIVYESDSQRAEAKAVGSGLLAIPSFVDEVNRAFKEDEQILVKARPFASGSLEIPLELIVFGMPLLDQGHPLFVKLREVIADYFKIKELLRGQPIHVEDGNVIIIENSRIHVDQITLQCLNPSSEVSRRCSEAFHNIEKDKEIKEIKITSSSVKMPLAQVRREKFPYFYPEIPVALQNLGQRFEESREVLVIRQPAFDAELTWRFVWRDTKISAKVEDEDFQRRVEAGEESFVAGDSLEVNLKRLQKYDPASLTYIDDQYTIKRVLKHYRRTEQKELFE